MLLAVIFADLNFAVTYFMDYYFVYNVNLSEQLANLVKIAWGVSMIGMKINAMLAIFNLLPFGNFDGYKVFQWIKKAWVIAFVCSIGLYALIYWAQYSFFG